MFAGMLGLAFFFIVICAVISALGGALKKMGGAIGVSDGSGMITKFLAAKELYDIATGGNKSAEEKRSSKR